MTTSAYSYRAARGDGTVELGTLDAASREAASSVLSSRGLWVLDVRLAATVLGRQRLSSGELALGLRLLGSLLEAGLPVARALAAFTDVAPDGWRPALSGLAAGVREGQSLGATLATCPIDIPPVVIGMVQAGEAGSGLAAAVLRAADLMESAAATRAAIRGALVYPTVLTVAGSASLALLVGVVLPRFAKVLADLGAPLPPTTRIVLDLAALARAGAVPGAVALVVGLAAWHAWVGTANGRVRRDTWLLTLPLIGTIRRAAGTARVGAAVASLLDSGVPIAPALLAGARAAGDAAIEARLMGARTSVITGTSLSHALATTEAATPTVVRLVRAGEESGRLSEMLHRAAVLETDRTRRLVTGVVRLLEPALILVFGGIVAFVAAALLEAVYSVRPT
ncbi:MAG TPA: type II secretion system F family protein [Gemmatimonadaceae bacterium]|jgi:type II secretory pathway component PulF|nr:type II secretion system F family protein [Gemmatimonadaceae bacterium]